MKKRKSQVDSDDTGSVGESDKQNVFIPINKNTEWVGILNSVKVQQRIQIVIINKYVVI